MAFSNPIIGGNDTLVRDAIQSEGFQTGVAGWRIERNGDAEFNDVIVRGTLEARNGDAFIRLDPAEPELAFNPDDTNYVNGTLNFVDLAGAGVETTLTGGRDAGQGVPSLVLTSNALANGTARMQASQFEVSGDLIFLNDSIGRTRYAIATVAENVNNSNVMQDDDELFMAVEANATYEVIVCAAYGTAVNCDLRTAWSVPAGASCTRYTFGATQTAAAFTSRLNTAAQFGERSPTTVVIYQQDPAGNQAIMERGILITAGTSGNVRFRWCQDVPTVGNLTRNTSSYMKVHRIA